MFPSVRIFTDSVGLRSSLLCLKTGVTEDWASAFLDWARLERHLTCCSAVGANSIVHFASCHAVVLALVAAILTTLRSLKALRRIEFLLTSGELKRGTAIAARNVLIHKRNGEGK